MNPRKEVKRGQGEKRIIKKRSTSGLIATGVIVKDSSKVKQKWKVGGKIGGGSYGTVYSVSKIGTGLEELVGDKWAIKFGNNEESNISLKGEAEFYEKLHSSLEAQDFQKNYNLQKLGIPECIASGVHKENGKQYTFFIMPRFDLDLSEFVKKNGNKLPLKMTEEICVNLIYWIELTHILGYLHCDIKPENILLSNMDSSEFLPYLCDFDLTTSYRNAETGTHISEDRDSRCWHGTPAYMSLDAHQGCFSRKSDLMSLGFVLYKILAGFLPWEKISENDENKKNTPAHNNIFKSKEAFMENLDKSDELCRKFLGVDVVTEFLRTVKELEFMETPDYNKFRDIISKLSLLSDNDYIEETSNASYQNNSVVDPVNQTLPCQVLTVVAACRKPILRQTRKRIHGGELHETDDAALKRSKVQVEHDTPVAGSSKNIPSLATKLKTKKQNMQETCALITRNDVQHPSDTSHEELDSATSSDRLNFCTTNYQEICSTSHAQKILSASDKQLIPSSSEYQRIPSTSDVQQISNAADFQQISSASHGLQNASLRHVNELSSSRALDSNLAPSSSKAPKSLMVDKCRKRKLGKDDRKADCKKQRTGAMEGQRIESAIVSTSSETSRRTRSTREIKTPTQVTVVTASTTSQIITQQIKDQSIAASKRVHTKGTGLRSETKSKNYQKKVHLKTERRNSQRTSRQPSNRRRTAHVNISIEQNEQVLNQFHMRLRSRPATAIETALIEEPQRATKYSEKFRQSTKNNRKATESAIKERKKKHRYNLRSCKKSIR